MQHTGDAVAWYEAARAAAPGREPLYRELMRYTALSSGIARLVHQQYEARLRGTRQKAYMLADDVLWICWWIGQAIASGIAYDVAKASAQRIMRRKDAAQKVEQVLSEHQYEELVEESSIRSSNDLATIERKSKRVYQLFMRGDAPNATKESGQRKVRKTNRATKKKPGCAATKKLGQSSKKKAKRKAKK